jgi:hypothetical protein
MPSRLINFFLAFLVAGTICISCGDNEKKARDMLVQSHVLLKKAKWIELKEHLNKILSEYPETKAATAATAMLDEMVKRANHIAETALKGAFVASVGYLASHPNEELNMTKLNEFGFRATEGVEIEIVRGEADDFLITSEHVAGDKVYSVGRDGRIEYEEYIED